MTLAHDARAIHRVHQRLRLRVEEIARYQRDHVAPSILAPI